MDVTVFSLQRLVSPYLDDLAPPVPFLPLLSLLLQQTIRKGIYRVTYRTGVRVWRVTVYWRRRNRYLGTYNSELAGECNAAMQAVRTQRCGHC